MVKTFGSRRWTENVVNTDFGSWHSTCVLSATPSLGWPQWCPKLRKGGKPSQALWGSWQGVLTGEASVTAALPWGYQPWNRDETSHCSPERTVCVQRAGYFVCRGSVAYLLLCKVLDSLIQNKQGLQFGSKAWQEKWDLQKRKVRGFTGGGSSLQVGVACSRVRSELSTSTRPGTNRWREQGARGPTMRSSSVSYCVPSPVLV